VEFGTSDLYPDITWRTVVEAFSEPAEGTMWLRAVCTAEFADSTGEAQKIELVHWLMALTDQQAEQFMQEGEGTSASAEQIISDINGAAKYAGVETDTIQQWLKNGLVVMNDGAFLKHNLDIFVRSKGNPTDAARAQQVHSPDELGGVLKDNSGGQNDMPQPDRQGPANEDSTVRPPIGNPGQTGAGGVIRERPRN
jgi:hypothetical protein